METNYLECGPPEWNFKINYPASWLRVDRAFVGPPVVVGFMSPKESPSDPFMESVQCSDLKMYLCYFAISC